MGRYYLSIISSALILFILTGCAATKVVPSGFMGDSSVYAALKDHPSLDGVQVVRYRAPETLRGGKFIVPPVKIYLSSEGQKRDIPRDDLAELAVFFHNKVFDQLSESHTITNVPGPGVYNLRLAITDADPNMPLLNVHPGTVISGAGLGGATVEMALEDSQTGELIMAATASKKGERYNYAAGLSKWGHTENVLEDFAQLIRQRIDELNSPQG